MQSLRHILRSSVTCGFRGITSTTTASFVARFGSVVTFAGCSGVATYVALQAPPSLCDLGDYSVGGKPTTKLFLRLRRKSDFNLVEIEKLWLEFQKIDRLGSQASGTQGDYQISHLEFAKFFSGRLNLDHAHMISLFRCFDKDNNHEIDFEEFVIGASKLCRGSTANKIG